MGMIRVAIADDHRLLLEGLEKALGSVPDFEVVATVEDGHQLLSVLAEAPVDVVLVDLDMPAVDGIEALRRLPLGGPAAIMVTMHADEAHRRRAASAGAAAFLSKSTPLPELATAVRAVAAGESLIDSGLTEEHRRFREPVWEEGPASLTSRERQLLALLADGTTTTEELADRLFISPKTVKNHLASIYFKLGISDRAQAAVEAIRLGLGGS